MICSVALRLPSAQVNILTSEMSGSFHPKKIKCKKENSILTNFIAILNDHFICKEYLFKKKKKKGGKKEPSMHGRSGRYTGRHD